MATFIRSVLQNRLTLANSSVTDVNLPPNPLSHVTLSMRFQTSAANVVPTWAQLLAALSAVEVFARGSTVFSMSMADLFAYTCAICKGVPAAFRINDDANNATGFLSLIIPFGRKLFDPTECFPATRSGELILRLTRQAADTAFTGIQFTTETIELPEAQPKRFLRGTTLNFSPTVVGDNDFQLYPSTIYAGLLLFSTTVPTGTVFTTTVDRTKLLLNNIEYDISQSNFETLWGEWCLRNAAIASILGHTHRENTAGAYTQNAETLTPNMDVHPLRQYCFHDFDPTGDDMYLVDARNYARVTLRVNAGDTQPARILPIELIDIGQVTV